MQEIKRTMLSVYVIKLTMEYLFNIVKMCHTTLKLRVMCGFKKN